MFSGIVVHGDGLGRDFGFPTANIDCQIKKGSNLPSLKQTKAEKNQTLAFLMIIKL